jgi:hypothetical protein
VVAGVGAVHMALYYLHELRLIAVTDVFLPSCPRISAQVATDKFLKSAGTSAWMPPFRPQKQS